MIQAVLRHLKFNKRHAQNTRITKTHSTCYECTTATIITNTHAHTHTYTTLMLPKNAYGQRLLNESAFNTCISLLVYFIHFGLYLCMACLCRVCLRVCVCAIVQRKKWMKCLYLSNFQLANVKWNSMQFFLFSCSRAVVADDAFVILTSLRTLKLKKRTNSNKFKLLLRSVSMINAPTDRY